MSLIRSRQRIITRVLPHDGNRRYLLGGGKGYAPAVPDLGPYAGIVGSQFFVDCRAVSQGPLPLTWSFVNTAGAVGNADLAWIAGPYNGAPADAQRGVLYIGIVAVAAVFGIICRATDKWGRSDDFTVYIEGLAAGELLEGEQPAIIYGGGQ